MGHGKSSLAITLNVIYCLRLNVYLVL